MKRRSFLKYLGLAPVVAVVPAIASEALECPVEAPVEKAIDEHEVEWEIVRGDNTVKLSPGLFDNVYGTTYRQKDKK